MNITKKIHINHSKTHLSCLQPFHRNGQKKNHLRNLKLLEIEICE